MLYADHVGHNQDFRIAEDPSLSSSFGGPALTGANFSISAFESHLPVEKLAFYATPPISPLAQGQHRASQLPGQPMGSERGMDSDERYQQQLREQGYQSTSDITGNPVRSLSGPSAEQSRQLMQQSARSDSAVPSSGRTSTSHSYGAYPYSDQQPFAGQSMQPTAMTNSAIQYPNDFTSPAARQQQSQQAQHSQQYPNYGPNVIYNVNQQTAAQQGYQPVVQYQPRQPTPVESIPQYGIPQYFPPGNSSATGVAAVPSQYINAQMDSSTYAHQTVTSGVQIPQTYPVSVAEYETIGMTEASNVPMNEDDAYERYHHALRQANGHTYAGRVEDASRSLLRISQWLVDNIENWGLAQDQVELQPARRQLWEEFNTCWLAVGQKQKDLTMEWEQTGRKPPGLLAKEAVDEMWSTIVDLCDKLEPHGLVDYQMGVSEEEISAVFQQCSDLLRGEGPWNSAEGSSSQPATTRP